MCVKSAGGQFFERVATDLRRRVLALPDVPEAAHDSVAPAALATRRIPHPANAESESWYSVDMGGEGSAESEFRVRNMAMWRRAFFAASIGLYVFSLILPSAKFGAGSPLSGAELLYSGCIGILVFLHDGALLTLREGEALQYAPWLANPIYGAMLLTTFGRGWRSKSMFLGLLALLTGLAWLVIAPDPPLIGYFTWIAAIVCGTLATSFLPRRTGS